MSSLCATAGQLIFLHFEVPGAESELARALASRVTHFLQALIFLNDLLDTSQQHQAGRASSSVCVLVITGKGALDNFCVDITARAAEGKIDPVIGRTREVQRVVEILARRTKNNPILLGEPGVGKTAIAEGLALRIVKDDVPEFLTVSGLDLLTQ